MEKYELKHIEKLRKMAPECMVLLKSNGSFPLDVADKIALYGSGARHTIKGGTGSGDVNVRSFVTIEDGLKNTGFTITTEDWLDAYEKEWQSAHKSFCEEIKERIAAEGFSAIMLGIGAVMSEPEYKIPMTGEGESAVYVLARVSGEGSDRQAISGDFKLTQTEIRDIMYLQKNYKKFLLVLNVGGVVDISPVADSVENILLISQTGMTIGDSFADVLLGKSFPSGKLTATWAVWEDYCHVGDFAETDDTRYKEGIYVGYRYFDTISKKPIFPFGYGKSYTDFDWNVKSLSLENSVVKVRIDVKNIGSYTGKEVLQLYVSVPSVKLDQPYQVLAAFEKTAELEPGQEQTLDLQFDMRSLASFDEDIACSVLEKGRYILRVGNSSDNTKPCGVVDLDKDKIVQKLSNSGGTPDFKDWKPEMSIESIVSADVPVLWLNAKDIAEVMLQEPVIDSRAVLTVKNMTDEELGLFCVGGFKDEGSNSFIGNAGMQVTGAAGETTIRFKKQNIPALVMADGPAGLRLAREYYLDEDGAHSLDSGAFAAIAEVLPEPMMVSLGLNEKKDTEIKGEIYNQYCSAIPVGTAIAQSWNIKLAEECGDLVGSEMEQFGVHLWLAPALNIQRLPLCGRNFEYYSEDPLISGKIAAGITRGTQKHSGCGVTIKHYCCNNQETNRMRSNTIVSQRALRDIYLKGFEISIHESNPMTVMTSYNLLNGEHTSQREDIIETILRREWGFDGVVMSDWVTAGFSSANNGKYKYLSACAHGSIKAGNDIMMPGGKIDHENLMKALENPDDMYHLTRKNLEKCAARVIALAWKLGRREEIYEI